MKFKIQSLTDFGQTITHLVIYATKTTWDDLPYQNENGAWMNQDKHFHVSVPWLKNPHQMAESLDIALNGLMHIMEKST